MNEMLEWVAVCGVTHAIPAGTTLPPQPATALSSVPIPSDWRAIVDRKARGVWPRSLFHNTVEFVSCGWPSNEALLVRWRDQFPGVFVITADGRALVLTGYDFWKNKPRDEHLLVDFLIKLIFDPRVAQVYDVGSEVTLAGKQPVRVYSEEDFWVVLENPNLVLTELEGVTSAVQRLNALKVELAALEQQKAELEAHMALLAQQAQMTAGEQTGTQAELAAAQQQLNAIMQQEAAKLAQASALEQSVSAASKTKTTALLVGGAALLAVGYLVLRKR